MVNFHGGIMVVILFGGLNSFVHACTKFNINILIISMSYNWDISTFVKGGMIKQDSFFL